MKKLFTFAVFLFASMIPVFGDVTVLEPVVDTQVCTSHTNPDEGPSCSSSDVGAPLAGADIDILASCQNGALPTASAMGYGYCEVIGYGGQLIPMVANAWSGGTGQPAIYAYASIFVPGGLVNEEGLDFQDCFYEIGGDPDVWGEC